MATETDFEAQAWEVALGHMEVAIRGVDSPLPAVDGVIIGLTLAFRHPEYARALLHAVEAAAGVEHENGVGRFVERLIRDVPFEVREADNDN